MKIKSWLRFLRQNWLDWLPGCVALTVVMNALAPVGGRIGHDYTHYYPRILIGVVHFWKNGFDIPYFTSVLCGGIPFFADPQSSYYSLPQFLSFFLEPFRAALYSSFLCYLIGYVGMLRFASEITEFPRRVAHLVALAYLLNGFAYAHLLVGHITHHTFLIQPYLLYLLFRSSSWRSLRFLSSAAQFSLGVIYMFYSGGTHMVVVFLASLALFLPWLIYAKEKALELKEAGIFLGASAAAVLFATSGKLIASYLFSPQLMIRGLDTAGMGVFHLVTQYFFFNPYSTPDAISFGQYDFGPWEYIGFFTRAAIPAILIFLISFLKVMDQKKAILVAVSTYLFLALLVLSAGGPMNASLPLIKGYHNPIKLLAAFISLLALVFGFALSHVGEWKVFSGVAERAGSTLFLLAAVLLIGEFTISANFIRSNPNSLGFQWIPQNYEILKKRHEFIPTTEVYTRPKSDELGVYLGYTTTACYEPLFGYAHEMVHAQLVEGKSSIEREGYFNINHPGCFLYGGVLGCKGWDRIPTTSMGDFKRFTEGEGMANWVPLWHRLLISLNFVFIFVLVGVIFYCYSYRDKDSGRR